MACKVVKSTGSQSRSKKNTSKGFSGLSIKCEGWDTIEDFVIELMVRPARLPSSRLALLFSIFRSQKHPRNRDRWLYRAEDLIDTVDEIADVLW